MSLNINIILLINKISWDMSVFIKVKFFIILTKVILNVLNAVIFIKDKNIK